MTELNLVHEHTSPKSEHVKPPETTIADGGFDMERTSFKGRDDSVDAIVEAANAAFARIKGHRMLFRRDWLPFLDGVYSLSLQAWERTELDGTPDWTKDRVQVEFRKLTAALPWAGFFDDRRTLLSVLRHIGSDRENFLKWYDDLPEKVRERTGYPDTLWGLFKDQKKKPEGAAKKKPHPDTDHNNEQAAANNDSTTEHNAGGASDQAGIRTDDDRVAELVAENERWHNFGRALLRSVDSGESTLEAVLREELDRLLEDAA